MCRHIKPEKVNRLGADCKTVRKTVYGRVGDTRDRRRFRGWDLPMFTSGSLAGSPRGIPRRSVMTHAARGLDNE